jgi:DHA1 family bicyclomycin/chloramphenicol resistance-like MFS transporter
MKNPHSALFVVFLAALAALPPLSIDMALPALHDIGASLRVAPGAAGLTLSVFMAGFAITPLIYGPVSDRVGRRPVLLFGLGLFTVGSLACACSASLILLLASRFAEGAGAGAGISMAFAVVRDLFEGAQSRAKLSYVQMVTSVAPLLAPSLGALVLSVANWRAIYGVLGALGAVLVAIIGWGFKESHARAGGPGSMFGQIRDGYKILFSSRRGMGFALVFALSFGVQFSFIAGSPLVFMGHFGASARIYGLVFAATSCGIMAGAFLNTRLSKHGIPGERALQAGFCAYLGTSAAMLTLCATGALNAVNLTALLVLSAFAFGVIGPNASHGALDAMPQIAGIAGAILTSLQMGVAVLASALVAVAYGDLGLYAMLLPMLSFGILATLAYILMAHAPRGVRSLT